MESASTFPWLLASSSVWLTVSGLLLWLGLRSRLQISASTRAAASFLIVLQGWIWIGIPIEIDVDWMREKWASHPSRDATPIKTVLPLVRPPSLSRTHSDLTPVAGFETQSESRRPASEAGPFSPTGSGHATTTMTDVRQYVILTAGVIWMAGIAVLLWRSIRGFVALSPLVEALPCAKVEWQAELLALCVARSIARPPQLKIGKVASPMLVQTWRAAWIVVPGWLWQSCTAEQRTSILLHELAHYRRGDVWRQFAMRLLVLPHWFNPVAWWAAKQFQEASEAACDIAACGSDPQVAIAYSKALLVLNERLDIRYAHALAMSGGSLTERVRRILSPEFQKESQMSRFLMLSAMTVLAGLATIRIQAADESSAAKDETGKTESAREPGVLLKRRTITEEYEKNEPAKATAAALLANGGFEEVGENSRDPQSWFATRVPDTAGHYLLASSAVAHSGQRSVVLEIGDSHPDRRVDYNWTAKANGWKTGETYELSGWIKVENAKGPGFLMAQCWSEDEKRIIGYSQSPCTVTGTTDWTRVRTLLKVPEGTGSVRIRAGLTSEGNQAAKAWFDDISLVMVQQSAPALNKSKPAKNETAPSPDASLLANGDFEEVQENSDDPQAWFGTRVPQTAGHFLLASSSVAHGGQRSAVVEIGENHPDRRVAYNWTAVAKGWKAGETYELSGWIKTENVKQPAFIMAQFWSEEGMNGKMLGGATTQTAHPVKGSTDWTRVSTRLKVPEGTGVVRIRAGLSSQGNSGAKAWLDEISLGKVTD